MIKEGVILKKVEDSDLELLETNPEEFWSNVDSIDKGAFKNLQNLVSITISNIDYIDDYAFADCKNLKTVIIGKITKGFGRNVFKGCSNLEKLVI